MPWDPAQYARFQSERAAPFYDLLDLVEPRPGLRAVDLGCGTGELTREVHRRLACKSTTGYDLSPEMLARSGAFAGAGLSFERADLGALALPPRSVDLVFTNAALHWVPDHAALLERLAGWLAPDGQLAFQVPSSFDDASHAVADELARETPYVEALAGYRLHVPVLAPERYAALLFELGFRDQTVRLQVYPHKLGSREDVVEWMKGTLLTPYEERLGALFPRFLADYRARLFARVPDTSPFFFPYKRILAWARR